MVKTLEQAIAKVERPPAEDQEQIGGTLLSHVEKLRALRAEIDRSIRSLDAGQRWESSIEEFIRQKTGSMAEARQTALWSPEAIDDRERIWDYYAQVAGGHTAEKLLR